MTGTGMPRLEFHGKVRSNKGKFHKDMVVPGRDSLAMPPETWPGKLAPGTLNIEIDVPGVPGDFAEIGTGDGMKRFDEGNFTPAVVIPQHEISGNTLKPKPGQPRRGTAQVWRAELSVMATGETAQCWMLRRIGSSIASQIELVSEHHLRSRLNLENGTPVKVVVFEG